MMNKKNTDEAAQLQHEFIGVVNQQLESKEKFQKTQHKDAQWFGNGTLGLFLHWGLSSLKGITDLSWGMMYNTGYDSHLNNTNKIAPEEYFALAKEFNPDKYDPDKWLKPAAKAGFKYAVLTTKHHEGYALWPSKFGDFNTGIYMQGRDLVKQYVDACRNNGLKVGLYYSPPDWHYNREYMSFHYGSQGKFPERKHFNTKWEPLDKLPPKPNGFDDEFKAYIKGQVEELLTQYGKVDVLFFDGGPDAISIDRIRELQPGIVVNPRMHGYGDYLTPEGRLPDKKPEGWWELCENWTDAYESWGYDKGEKYKSTAWMLSRFSKIRGWGGNYLINVAPNSRGELPETCYQRIEELEQWMDINKEAVLETEAGPYPEQSNVPITVKEGIWYLHILPDSSDEVKIMCVNEPKDVSLLDGNRKFEYLFKEGTLSFTFPYKLRSGLVDIVRVGF